MSENLDLVRSIYSDWERGDFSSVEWADPEIEFEIADGPAPGRWAGVVGMGEGSRGYLSSWEHWRAEPEQFREIDDERVIVMFLERGRGKTSGVDLADVRVSGASLFCIRDGKVVRLAFYFDRDRALADLGLENVEIVRRFLAALVRAQDDNDWEPVIRELDPNVEIDDLDISLDTEHYSGPDKVRRWIGVWNESWESWWVDDEVIRPAGEDHVIALFQTHVTGKGSGIELSRRDAMVFKMGGHKITALGYYNDQQDALKALGLPE